MAFTGGLSRKAPCEGLFIKRLASIGGAAVEMVARALGSDEDEYEQIHRDGFSGSGDASEDEVAFDREVTFHHPWKHPVVIVQRRGDANADFHLTTGGHRETL